MANEAKSIGCWRFWARRAAVLLAGLLAIAGATRAQNTGAPKAHVAQEAKGANVSPLVSLLPRLIPGQKLRYEMELETTTETSLSGVVSDPQGPSSLTVDWNTTVRIEVLDAGAETPGGVRLRTTYEKSTASVRSDSYDPAAAETQQQYQKLEGKVVEFTLGSTGKVKLASGLEGMAGGEKAAETAQQWIAQFSSSAGAPATGVRVGQTWSSEQPASSLPIAGFVWRSDAEYLRNESCHPPNPDLPGLPAGADASAKSETAETCAVVLTKLNLVRPKTVHDMTPEELRKNGVQSAGTWSGSGQSLTYISLTTGLVVSVTQTGIEEMDVTLTTNRNASIHYAGKISSRSQVALVADESKEK